MKIKNYNIVLLLLLGTQICNAQLIDKLKKDDRLHYLRVKKINKGIKVSNGDIISIIHSDDFFYDENVLSFVENYFNKISNLDCLIGTTLIKKNDSQSILRRYNPTVFKRWMLYVGFSPPKMIHRILSRVLILDDFFFFGKL